MKINVGMYVRTKETESCNIASIRYILEINKDAYSNEILLDEDVTDGYGNLHNDVREEDIDKASYNIIEVIKEGDYVNGSFVLGFKTLQTGEKAVIVDGLINYGWGQGVIPENEIKGVETKEVFEAQEYLVMEEYFGEEYFREGEKNE